MKIKETRKMFQLKYLLYFLLFCLNSVGSGKPIKVEVIFIQDFLQALNYSNPVVAYLCWGKDDIMSLSRALSSNFVSHSILNNIQINIKDIINYNRNIFIVDMTCKDANKFVLQGKMNNLFETPFIWLLLGSSQEIIANNFYFPINSAVYTVTKYDNRFNVTTIYKNKENESKYIENDIAEWKSGMGLLCFQKFSTRIIRTNLMGAPIKTSYVIADKDSLNHLWDYRNTHIDQLSKINYLLINSLIELFNASKVDIWANTWGYKNKTTNSYDGMFGDLMNGRADISGSTAFCQLDRMEHFKFIVPTTYDKLRFIFRAPPLSYTANVFILPFNTLVWGLFFLIMLLSIISIYIIALYEWRYDIKVDTERRNKMRPRILEVIMLHISALTQRGGHFETNTFSGRAVSLGTFILCMFMYTAFSGYIVVLLQSTSNSIKDLGSLYDSKIEIGIEDTIYNKYYFTTPSIETNETYRKLIYENRVAPKGKNPRFFSAKDGLEKVKSEFFAFNTQVATAYNLIKQTFKDDEKCKIRDIDTIIKSDEQPYLSIPKNSIYGEIFAVGFRRLFETGLHKREYVKFFSSKPECHGRQSNYVSVGLIDCYFPFIIFGTGIIISGSILLIEIVVEKLIKKMETRLTMQYLY